MTTCEFTYHRPRCIEEACELVRTLGEGAYFLAGGTELLPEFAKGQRIPRHLVSLRDLPGLDEIRQDGEYLRIGAMATLETISRSPLVREACPVLAEAAGAIGSVQIRTQGTLGGNFCGAVPCADTPPAAIVSSARVGIVGPGRERGLSAEELFRGPRATALDPGELLTEVLVPLPPPGFGAAFARFGLRKGMAVAVASVAAGLRLDEGIIREARIALGAVAPVPLLAAGCSEELAGQPPTREVFERAAEAAAAEARPISDLRGSEEYRRAVVRVLARRALGTAATRAGEGRP